MKVNIAVSAHNSLDWDRVQHGAFDRPADLPDAHHLRNGLALGDLVEPLGFDGIWVGEHFGTPYNLTPNPLQTLAWFAARTERISLGTIVLVLPWWHPIRLAHQIAYLDIISNGRFDMIGVGRGVSHFEFDALGIDRNESRERFGECLDILDLALGHERFEYDGRFFRIPETSIRPLYETRDLMSRCYAASSTGSSLELCARRGLKPLFVGNKPLSEAAKDVRQVNIFRHEEGLAPCQPNNILFMYCAANAEELRRSDDYVAAANRDVLLHYGLDKVENFAGVKGYEEYAANAGGATSVSRDGSRPSPSSTYDESNLLIGTPETIIERIVAGQKSCSYEQICLVPNIGTMPHEVSRKSLELFAREVLPIVHKMEAPLQSAVLPDFEPI
jgi:alkanesulfonate monooxygenase SsuD/methylene tetrahydromethanopterin reductase-like flavin-dependent oxidoreductase (luciferase family)